MILNNKNDINTRDERMQSGADFGRFVGQVNMKVGWVSNYMYIEKTIILMIIIFQ